MPWTALPVNAGGELSLADGRSDAVSRALLRAHGVIIRDVVAISHDPSPRNGTPQQFRHAADISFPDPSMERLPVIDAGRPL